MKHQNHTVKHQSRASLFTVFIALLFASTGALNCNAEVKLPSVFSDHMVLQRDKPLTIWGWAAPAEKISISLSTQSAQTTADNKGNWHVKLKPIPGGFDEQTLNVKGASNEITINHILIGEVWLCGGQSNMAWRLSGSRDADIEIDSADYPAIRFLRLPNVANPHPQNDIPIQENSNEGKWRKCTPENVGDCTAVGYFFAKRLHRRLKVPVGIIDNSWGGTMAQHWCNKNTLKQIPEMKSYIEEFDAKLKTWIDAGGEQGAKKRYEQDLIAYEKAKAIANQKGEREPRRPNPNSYKSPGTGRQPAGMFNALVIPLANYSFRGILFYQGENNSFGTSWKPFYKTFPSVISDWRKNFADPDLPFGIIQIAGWSNRRSMTYDMNHHTNVVREIQHITWNNTKNTGLIATYDTNSNGSIHPGRKQPVGERSARWALAEVYDIKQSRSDRKLEWQGPVYESHKIEGNKITVKFTEESSKGLRLDQDLDVGFYIAGEDKVFHHASARVDARNHSVIVWNDQVTKPLAVRYAISNLPIGGLMNGRELPAYPFRTDQWPIKPHQSTGTYHVGKPHPVVEDQ